MSVAMPRVMTRGVVFIHSTPKALCPHITWALESALDGRLSIDWTPQPAGAALVRAEFPWAGVQGTGAKLASTLRGWDNLRYEVTADDPQTWPRPWTAALDMAPQPEGMFEYACHEGNNSMRNILSGARAAER